MIRVENVSITYYDRKKSESSEFQVENIHFILEKGEVLGIIGRNGCGKTTLLKSLVGLKGRDAGEVEYDGLFLGKDNKQIKEKIAFVSHEWLFDLNTQVKTIRDFYGSFYSNFDRKKFDELCEQFEIYSKSAGMLMSLGEKAKLSLILALSRNPEVLIMDEPLSNLDPVVRAEIMDLLRDYMADGEKNIIYSTHMIHELEQIADKILYMKNGKQEMCMDMNEIQDTYFAGRRVDLEELFEIFA